MQSYKEILNFMLKRSGLTLEEVAEGCKKNGVYISASYLSKLRLGHRPPPSNNISKMIATVCNFGSDNLIDAANTEKTPVPVARQLSIINATLQSIVDPVIEHIINDDTTLTLIFKSRGLDLTPEEARAILDDMALFEQVELLKENGLDFNVAINRSNFNLDREPVEVSTSLCYPLVRSAEEATEVVEAIKNSFPEGTVLVSEKDKIDDAKESLIAAKQIAPIPLPARHIPVLASVPPGPRVKVNPLPIRNYYVDNDIQADYALVASGANMTGGCIGEGDLLLIEKNV
jgi:transcriptional regulator with XRE-family HTH domain